MKFQIRHFIYVLGLLAIPVSYLLWAIVNGSSFIFLAGFLTSLIAFIFILTRDRWKMILISLALAIATYIIIRTSGKYLVGRSYNFILIRHEEQLDKVNKLLISKKGEIYYPSTPGHEDSILSRSEKQVLDEFLKKTGIWYIQKYSTNLIFYPVWGVPLESHYGLYYMDSNRVTVFDLIHIKGKWYYDN